MGSNSSAAAEKRKAKGRTGTAYVEVVEENEKTLQEAARPAKDRKTYRI